MKIFNKFIKVLIQVLFFFIFFSTANSNNPDKFNRGDNISNYFSGILLLNNNQFQDSSRLFKKLDGLEKYHINYSSRYLFSLINIGKFEEAFNYSQKLEKEKLSSFESVLIIGIYYLKNGQYDLAKEYFSKLKNKRSKFLIDSFISNSLVNWTSIINNDLETSEKLINSIDSRFENLKKIQNTFLHCFYQSKKTELLFKNLSLNKATDFSRYSYFYALYLNKLGKTQEAEQVIISSLEINPRNLLLRQYQIDSFNGKFKNNFNCTNISHVVAEILYITANALSSQNVYTFSNFYLNLSKYLNENFISFDTLLAENFYKMNNLKLAKKIYNKIEKEGKIFKWYSAKHF